MWLLPLTRRELVDLITPRQPGYAPAAVEAPFPSLHTLAAAEMVAVWPEDPATFGLLPTVIIVPDGASRDSLAWLGTYVRDLRPFTAFCRVVERSIAEGFAGGERVPRLRGLEGVCCGLILGEALAHSAGTTARLEFPVAAYSATLSHAIARTLALTGGSISAEIIARLWTQARMMTGQSDLVLPTSAILSVWSVALDTSHHPMRSGSLFEPANVLAAAWSELAVNSRIGEGMWRRLVEGLPDLEAMRDLTEMPREQRVQMIDIALHVLAASGRDERRAFLAGYFTSLLGPGSLDHADILGPVAPLLPTAYLWYGLCAAANGHADALPVGNPLARRIVRDLTIPDRFIDRPRCDIALEELAMHGASENLLRMTSRGGRLDIDILPGVTTSLRWGARDFRHDNDEDKKRRAKEAELRQFVDELEQNAVRGRQIAERLRASLSVDEGVRKLSGRRKR